MNRIAAIFAIAIVPSIAAAVPRLGGEVVPYEYRLEVRPDLVRETFVVDEAIRVRVSEPVSSITLHAAGLEVESASVRGTLGKEKPRIEIDAEAETLTLRLARALAPGEAEIRLTVRGTMGHSLRGFYLSESSGRRYALTQLQPADARRFFACFDEPAIKAQFDLIAVVDARVSAISNGRIVSIAPGLVPGTKRIRFDKTPPISTYMLALAIGEFDCLNDRSGGVQIRFCAQPENVTSGRYALAAAKKSFEFFEDYTGVDYPFDKLDLVAVPDFSPGGMENPGAIFLREATVLVDAEKASLETRRWVATLVAHELSHMWVGDLVTARWWDDLWLNEGLGTWLSRKALAATQPELEPGIAVTWSTLKALELDGLEGSRPPRAPVDDPSTVFELFDAITNEKPASAIAMAESIGGEDAMRSALRSYLVAWSWGSATTDDFLESVEPQLGSDGVATIRDFVSRPGYPRIDVASRCLDGQQVISVSQRPVRESLKDAGPWTLPICVRQLPRGAVSCSTMRGTEMQLVAGECGSDVIVNPGFAGFYRTAYERGVVGGLLERQHAALSPGERIMLLDAEWSSFRAGDRTVGEVLESAELLLAREGSAPVLSQVAMQLSSIQESIADETDIGAFRHWVAAAARAGSVRAAGNGSDEAQRKLESELAWIGGVIGDDPEIRAKAVAFAKDYLRDPWKDRNTDPEVMLAIAGRAGDAALFDALATRLRKTRSEPERYRLAWALGFFLDPELVDRTLRMTIDGTVRGQVAATTISRLLSRRETSEQAWKFVRDEWPKLREELPPGFTGDRIVRAAGSFCDTTRRAEVERFFSSPDAPSAPRALASSLASIDACIALRERHRGELGTWLAAAESTH